MGKKLTPYQRVVRAAEAGRGLSLSADEVWKLAQDHAIREVAEQDDDPEVREAAGRSVERGQDEALKASHPHYAGLDVDAVKTGAWIRAWHEEDE